MTVQYSSRAPYGRELEPVVLHCRPSPDYLPHPEAILVHGVSPSRAINDGVTAAEFARRVHAELTAPNTTNIAYNAIGFDREVVWHLFFRSLLAPYAGLGPKAARALTLSTPPCGIRIAMAGHRVAETSRLRAFLSSRGSGCSERDEHENAHDALEDVLALLGVARLLKEAQPKHFQYGLSLRSKDVVRSVVQERCSTSPAASFRLSSGAEASWLLYARIPKNENEVLVYGLRCDPTTLEGLTAD